MAQPPMARIMSLYLSVNLAYLRTEVTRCAHWTSSSVLPDRILILHNDTKSIEIGINFIFLSYCSDKAFNS